MSQNKPVAKKKNVPSLSDDDIVTVNVDRRSFLSKVGLGTAALGATLATGCGGSDECDISDPTFRDSDPGDMVLTKIDRCDED